MSDLLKRISVLEELMDISDWKLKALQKILDTNPMHADYHADIRFIDDILTLDEAYQSESPTNPDVSDKDIERSITSGKITVYSSSKIIPGSFISPSRTMAKDYAGSNKVNIKSVNINEVAWINCDEGVYVGKIN